MAPRSKSAKTEEKEANLSSGESKDSEVYRLKRDRNNVAVKKSREKSRQKAKESTEKMVHLRKENEELEQKVEDLSKELGFLKRALLSKVAGNKMKKNQISTDISDCSSNGSQSRVVLADPQTVHKDHEYVGTS